MSITISTMLVCPRKAAKHLLRPWQLIGFAHSGLVIHAYVVLVEFGLAQCFADQPCGRPHSRPASAHPFKRPFLRSPCKVGPGLQSSRVVSCQPQASPSLPAYNLYLAAGIPALCLPLLPLKAHHPTRVITLRVYPSQPARIIGQGDICRRMLAEMALSGMRMAIHCIACHDHCSWLVCGLSVSVFEMLGYFQLIKPSQDQDLRT